MEKANSTEKKIGEMARAKEVTAAASPFSSPRRSCAVALLMVTERPK